MTLPFAYYVLAEPGGLTLECKKEVTHLHTLHVVPVSQRKSKHDQVPTIGNPGQEPKLLKAPPFHVAP